MRQAAGRPDDCALWGVGVPLASSGWGVGGVNRLARSRRGEAWGKGTGCPCCLVWLGRGVQHRCEEVGIRTESLMGGEGTDKGRRQDLHTPLLPRWPRHTIPHRSTPSHTAPHLGLVRRAEESPLKAVDPAAQLERGERVTHVSDAVDGPVLRHQLWRQERLAEIADACLEGRVGSGGGGWGKLGKLRWLDRGNLCDKSRSGSSGSGGGGGG
eukprot:355172-Chlamydomonas_euryale.AAC.1